MLVAQLCITICGRADNIVSEFHQLGQPAVPAWHGMLFKRVTAQLLAPLLPCAAAALCCSAMDRDAELPAAAHQRNYTSIAPWATLAD
jgi:hypothetical protein